ncbi:MAG: hypothetical protein KDB24_00535 [Microthrixaceae bacterium]|nr:hypothetical protein [Microthrixaceae bacterium]
MGAQQPDPTSSTVPPLQEQRPLPTRVTTAPTVAPTTGVDDPGEPAPSSDAPASTGPAVTEVIPKGEGLNNALPRPNSGHAPEYQGDRGTGSQYAVLGAMLLAFAVIAGLVVRQSRRSKLRWSAAAPMAGAPRDAGPGAVTPTPTTTPTTTTSPITTTGTAPAGPDEDEPREHPGAGDAESDAP